MKPTTADQPNFVDYYHLERYLFKTVSPRYHEAKTLNAFDFFCIVVWKANRAKSKIAARLLSYGHATLDLAVKALTSQLIAAKTPQARLNVLFDSWGFRLPMATAVLTVLYPKDFTVYDVRVCDTLADFHSLNNHTNSERRWKEYQRYKIAVKARAPAGLSLRDKDRWLWGKSFAAQLEANVADAFKQKVLASEADA
jgi:hypothetical protein